ncbi:MAG: bifunctional 2-polyprenyl-6-hydroxyphenol methylase/3-demethylubiquinol 3-O-methyltransferase UbiG [Hydrogenophilus sp.]|nr:bifunctional 2-polyprenyl-6-hydroxyphenol methylase/3-demethylubiquinol 3-O-methyltransferase UbiG [Hydrogenophilus sp.]
MVEPPSLSDNVDNAEIAKFSALAHRWWDPHGQFRPLHEINPLRLSWIEQISGGLQGKRVLDVGCGGGILTEALALKRASVTGIDRSEKALSVARLHSHETGVSIDYHLSSPEEFALDHPEAFDLVTCLEMLEHVPDPARTVQACARLARPGGIVIFSTLNRTLKAYLFAILGAEYFLNLLPRGTHDWRKFITPAELTGWCQAANLLPFASVGLSYNPILRRYRLSNDTLVNYIVAARKW